MWALKILHEKNWRGNLFQELCHPLGTTNKETGVRVVVWVDDFTFLGRDRYLKEIGAKIDEWYGGDHQQPRERQAGPPVSGEHAGTNDGEAYNTKLIQPQAGG